MSMDGLNAENAGAISGMSKEDPRADVPDIRAPRILAENSSGTHRFD
jgi:hypothetical protein